jgi:hypothetical protein
MLRVAFKSRAFRKDSRAAGCRVGRSQGLKQTASGPETDFLGISGFLNS